jgi:hypothetical protein
MQVLSRVIIAQFRLYSFDLEFSGKNGWFQERRIRPPCVGLITISAVRRESFHKKIQGGQIHGFNDYGHFMMKIA